MPRVKRVAPGAEWNELSTTAADWKAADPGLLAAMLGQLHLIRAFEETVLELAGAGLVHGPAHSSIGQEGGAVGSIVGLRSTDAVNGSHRGHHQFLAKALTHVTKGALDLEQLVTPEVQEVLQRTLAEILGLAQGYCAGRGGSMHLQWLEAGALGTNAIVGGGVPMAAGNAWAQLHSGTSDITVTYFGDGAANIGSVLESLNLDVGLAAAALLLHREQPLRGLDHGGRGDRRAAAVRARHRVRDPGLAGRRDGSARGAPGDGAGAAAAAGGRRAGRDRGAGLPLLPSERAVPRQRVRLPDQGGGGGLAGARPPRPGRGRDDRARPDRRGRGRGGAVAGAGRDAAGGRRAGRAGSGRGPTREPAHPAGAVARPCLRRRRDPRRPVRDRGRADGGAAGLHRGAADREVHRRGLAGDGPADGLRRAHRGARRGRAPAQRRHQRGHQGAGGEVPGPGARHADQRERVRRGSAAGSPWTAGSGRWSSSCTRTSSGSPPTRCSTRSARPGTCSAAAIRCRWCCGRRSRWDPGTGRSI